jgi:GH43 family beta-xylosidase
MAEQVRSARSPGPRPVHDGYFADPFVLATDGAYVAYGTGAVRRGRPFEVLTSPDLRSWTSVGGALTPVDAALGSDYWAPEVAVVDGLHHLYYSVGHGDRDHHLRVAVSTDPRGPFTDSGRDLTPDERFAIDPHPFRAPDGQWYLYYAHDVLDGERVGTMIAVDRLADMTTLAGSARTVLRPYADWQVYQRDRPMYGSTYDWHTLEGPSVVLRDGTYYCFYSAGSWLDESYAVSWATAQTPLGPWTHSSGPRSRLLTTAPGVVGPGHNSTVVAPDGELAIVYHAWDEARTARRMFIEPLRWDEAGPRVG